MTNGNSKRIFNITVAIILFFQIPLHSQNLVIKDISITGNTKTKPFVILNEIPVSTGDTVLQQNLNKLKKEIYDDVFNTGLFNYVTVDDSISGNMLFLKINVEERWYIWPYPILEQADINFSSFLYSQNWNRINYGIMTMWYNFRGRRDFLKVKFRKGYKQQYGITYYNPYINKKNRFSYSLELNKNIRHEYPVAIKNMNFEYYRNDTTEVYNNDYAKAAVYYRDNLYRFFAVSTELSHTSVNTDSLSCNFTIIKPAAYFILDKRDIHYYPLQGFYIMLKGSYSLFYGTGNNFMSFYADVRKYTKISGRVNFSARATLYPFINGFLYDYTAYTTSNIRATDLLIYPSPAQIQTTIKYNIMRQKSFKLNFIPFEKINKPFLAIYTGAFADAATVPQEYLTDKKIMSAGLFLDFVTYYDKVLRIEAGINSVSGFGIYINFGSAF